MTDMTDMTDETEAVARALAPMLEGGREFDQMPATRRELKIWNRAGMCSCNDATQDDAREAAQLAITTLDRHRIERAGELCAMLEVSGETARKYGHEGRTDLFDQAAATIASQRAEIERLTEREAQAKLDGVRAGIEAAARDASTWFPGQSVEKHSNAGVVASIIRLDAEAIAKGEG